MSTGKVKFYSKDKGFGFIIDDKTGKEIFVHASGLTGDLKTDDKVTFDTIEGKKGLNAVEVKILS